MTAKVVPLGIVVPAWLRAELDSLASERHMTLAAMLREMLADSVSRARCAQFASELEAVTRVGPAPVEIDME